MFSLVTFLNVNAKPNRCNSTGLCIHLKNQSSERKYKRHVTEANKAITLPPH